MQVQSSHKVWDRVCAQQCAVYSVQGCILHLGKFGAREETRHAMATLDAMVANSLAQEVCQPWVLGEAPCGFQCAPRLLCGRGRV